MEPALFVQNIKHYCELKGVKPTVACRESGVGTSFINNIDRGQTPSVAKVQMLATYLGVTVSELLGEEKSPAPAVTDEGIVSHPLLEKFDRLSPADQEKATAFIDWLLAQEASS